MSLLSLSNMPRKYKIILMILSDVVLLPVALWSAIALRYGTFAPEVGSYLWLFFVLPIVSVPLLARFGLYRAVIRYVDEKIIRTVIYGVTLSVLVLIAISVMARVQGLPRSSIVIYWVVSSSYIAASRYLARGVILTLQRKERRKVQVAIYGAGEAGIQTARALMAGPEYRPVLFFDDNPDLHGVVVANIRVYSPKNAVEIMDQFSCTQLLLALPSVARARRQEIIRQFEGQNIQLKTIPGMGELITGAVRVEDIREVGIEDLLGREPVPPFEKLIESCIKNKSVLVTGAGGSIGSELCRQIAFSRPKLLVLFERSEILLYQLDQELKTLFPALKTISILGDVQDQDRLVSILDLHRIETIYHAAAYKHVPLVEGNIISGVMNNVFGTLSAARAAIKSEVDTFVLISTDKAVRPTNVMGATKRLAELILQAFAADQIRTRFCMVRFGNVLGSSGSVIPLFKEQIRTGGPVTVTHPDVTRFFMTIPEASQLVIQAGALGKSGEVFVLDMGESIKISDLARKMIELSGFAVRDEATGKGDIAITYVGLRPGEKLFEELLIGGAVSSTEHPRIMKANEEHIELSMLVKYLDQMFENCKKGDELKVIQNLKDVVKEYKPVSQEEKQ